MHLFVCICVYACVYTCMCHGMSTEVRGLNGSQFLPLSMGILGTEFRSPGLPASTFTCWVILLTLLYIIKSSEMKGKFTLSSPCLVLLEYRASLMTRAFAVCRYYLQNYLSQFPLNFYHEGTLNLISAFSNLYSSPFFC